MQNIKHEHLKIMYDQIYDELNRSRDWPIKIMAFASAAYFGLFSLIKLDPHSVKINCGIKFLISFLLLGLLAWTIVVINKQHKNYLRYRNVQIELQKIMDIYTWKNEGNEIFDIGNFGKIRHISLSEGWLGWGFYAGYLFIIFLITLMLIWGT